MSVGGVAVSRPGRSASARIVSVVRTPHPGGQGQQRTVADLTAARLGGRESEPR